MDDPRALSEVCPFTGEKVTYIPCGNQVSAKTSKYIRGPFASEMEARNFMSLRKGKKVPLPAGIVMTKCPWTGAKIRYMTLGARKDVFIKGPDYVIGPFFDERRAQHFFSTRDGIPPSWPASEIGVTIRKESEDAQLNEIYDGLGNPLKGPGDHADV